LWRAYGQREAVAGIPELELIGQQLTRSIRIPQGPQLRCNAAPSRCGDVRSTARLLLGAVDWCCDRVRQRRQPAPGASRFASRELAMRVALGASRGGWSASA